MSPQRMAISSLLRDPSPPNDAPPRHSDRRSIDALLHHPEPHPANIHSILNSPPRPPPSYSRPPPFLGLDALVHVAAEERRRITALSGAPRFSPQDNPAPRHSLLHDHDRPSAHYTHPIASYPAPHRHPDLPSPHKRPRDSPPRPPSPDPRFPQLSSPSTRLRSSASPINNYPTLRLPIDSTPSRPAPPPLSVNDSRSSLQHTSPFLHSHHPLHSSPRDNSPLHHSPQHLRSQRHSSPMHTTFISGSPESLTISPRYTHGPKMAGGIEVLSNDSPSLRHDLSNYQSPGRDMSVERLVSDSRLEHTGHELPKLSPLSARAFPPDSDTQPEPLLHQVEGQDSVLFRQHLRLRPSRPPFDATADNTKYTGAPAIQASQLPSHPIRVWEDQPTVRETSQRVSPLRSLSILNPAEVHGERPVREIWRAELLQHVIENVPTPFLSTVNEPQLLHIPMPERSSLGSPAHVEGSHFDPPPQTRSPVHQTNVPQDQNLSAPCPPALDSHLEKFEAKYEPTYSVTLADASTNLPLVAANPVIAKPSLGEANQIPERVDAVNTLADPLFRQLSPQVTQLVPVSAKESGMSRSLATTSRSPSQQPLPLPSPIKDECNLSPPDVLTSALVPPIETPRRSPEPDNTSERELPTSEQIMMDVEKELLSLVEDHLATASSKTRAKSRSPPPTALGQGTAVGARQGPNDGSYSPLLTPSSQPVLKGHLAIDEEKDRTSMPPPAARSKKAEKDKTSPATSGSKKKKDKDGTLKPTAKPKQPPKPRVKPTPKPKPKPSVIDSFSKSSTLKNTVNVTARSRSTSVIPSTTDEMVPEPDVDNSDKEDDKLYCVCKTRYDEDRMMIACDRCDEWFHTLCVSMPDLEIDLVDQFICPPCIQTHPHLRTTWKRRCLFGLQHENPSSPEACHKPSRGAFSKYCSDDCGIKYMRAHIAQWEKSGCSRDLLWDSVKTATKREGVVICAKTNGASPRAMDVDGSNLAPESAAKRRAEREVARLNARLEELVKERELMKHELDVVLWREKVVDLASERAGRVDECGWDQRLCFGEEEWADFGPEVLESYEDARVKMESEEDTMPLDPAYTVHEEWWCTGKKKCERHAGWQKLRAAEVLFDKETKEGILLKLTTREREIRKNIEDILYPQATGTLQASFKLLHPEVQLNGLGKLP